MTSKDFPTMFQAADSCAISSQAIYLRLIKADIVLLILGPLLAILPELLPNFSISWLKNIGVLMSMSTIIVTLLIYLWGKDKAWYGSRAVAESIKTLTWRYITGATPFPIDMGQKDADRQFGNTLQKLMEQESKLNWVYNLDAKVDQITEVMRTQRNKSIRERKNYYIKSRLEEQCQWYARKAKFNTSRKNLFLFLIIIMQLLIPVLIYNAVQILTIAVASVFTTVATGLILWVNTKKYHELSQVYALTAQELGVIKTSAYHINSDKDLSDFVADTESAFSREHTMWIARRNHIPMIREHSNEQEVGLQ